MKFIPCLIILAAANDVAASFEGPNATFFNGTRTQPCDFTCPPHSKSILEFHCPRTIKDCECAEGTKKVEGSCICLDSFECPANSSPRIKCPVKPSHCRCKPGYKLVDDVCKCSSRECMGMSDCQYKCPALSRPKDPMECPANFGDCVCRRGYKKDGDECICDSKCPLNSRPKRNFLCPTSGSRHCVCKVGFVLVGGVCQPRCDYRCPPDSQPKIGVECAESFRDCRCAPGLKKMAGEECGCNTECPRNSILKTHLLCPLNAEADCICKPGYDMVGKDCVVRERADFGAFLSQDSLRGDFLDYDT